MKRIYEFITRTNQILFFVAALGAIGGISYLVFRESFRNYEPPHVPVAQTPEDLKQTVIKDVRFLGQASGLFVFGVVKREVQPARPSGGKGEIARFSSYASANEGGGEIVNVVFARGGRKVKTLLENDGLVLSHHLSGAYQSTKFKPHLFLCVTEDTDGNHVLDQRDQNELFVVADDLGKSDLIIRGVSTFDVVSPTHVVVKTGEPGAIRFWDVDTDTLEKTEIAWK